MSDAALKDANFSEDELRLLDASDADIEALTNHFSFDLDAMRSRLGVAFKSDEKWAIVMHAHLYLDHILTQTLIESLAKPQALRVDRLSFSQKIAFLDALRLLTEDVKRPVLAINKLRNSIAHEIDIDIAEHDITHLMSTMSRTVKTELGLDQQEDKFKGFILIIIALAESNRQRYAFYRLKRRQASLNAKRVYTKICETLENTSSTAMP